MFCTATVNARLEVPRLPCQATAPGRGHEAQWVLSFSMCPCCGHNCLAALSTVFGTQVVLGKHKLSQRWGRKKRGSHFHLSVGQVNAGAESSHSFQSKAQAFPGVFQGRVYCTVNSIGFQRSAFLKIFEVLREYFFFACSCHCIMSHPPCCCSSTCNKAPAR